MRMCVFVCLCLCEYVAVCLFFVHVLSYVRVVARLCVCLCVCLSVCVFVARNCLFGEIGAVGVIVINLCDWYV